MLNQHGYHLTVNLARLSVGALLTLRESRLPQQAVALVRKSHDAA
jgi:hypothetical protein